MKVNNIPLRSIELFVPIQSDPFSYKTEQQFSRWVVFPSCASWWHNDKMTWWHNDMTTWWLPTVPPILSYKIILQEDKFCKTAEQHRRWFLPPSCAWPRPAYSFRAGTNSSQFSEILKFLHQEIRRKPNFKIITFL